MAAKSLKQLKSLASKADKLSTQEIDGFLKQLKRFLDTALEEVVGEIMDGNSDPALALGGLLDDIKKKGLKGELAELATIYKGELKKVQSQYKEVGISIITNESIIEYMENAEIHIFGKVGQNVSIIPLNQASVLSSGLVYEMNWTELELPHKISTSNIMRSEKADIRVKGKVVIIRSIASCTHVTYLDF